MFDTEHLFLPGTWRTVAGNFPCFPPSRLIAVARPPPPPVQDNPMDSLALDVHTTVDTRQMTSGGPGRPVKIRFVLCVFVFDSCSEQISCRPDHHPSSNIPLFPARLMCSDAANSYPVLSCILCAFLLPCISAALLHAHCDFCSNNEDGWAPTGWLTSSPLQCNPMFYSVSQAAVGQSLGLILESGADRASGDLLEVELPTTDFSLARAAAERETSAFVLPAMELRGSGKEMKLEGLVTAFSRTTARTLNDGNGFHH
ncbi:uncharacterized protein P884DRAFT_305067 [Thermothelomyces heterothallicus CBS 202.75]|uniref:uncharacterized protein n=1 Tax=Thermothelomyces heterothallicus CBS 202.75 TaxID=1149848 RepID=UPI0037439F16